MEGSDASLEWNELDLKVSQVIKILPVFHVSCFMFAVLV